MVVIDGASASANTYVNILDASAGLSLLFGSVGALRFNDAKVVLGAGAVFQDYANAAVAQNGASSDNPGLGWFQYNNDTYLVLSLHDAASQPGFVNGLDTIVKLTGLIDLNTAHASDFGIHLPG